MHNNLKNLVNTFLSTVIEGIAQDVTERIDTVDNDSVQSIATDTIVDYDYTDIVTDHATDVLDNYDFSTVVEEAVDDIDFDYKVENVLSTTDFSTYIESAVDEIDFDTKVRYALQELDVKADCDAFADRLSALEARQDLIITALTNATDALRGLTDCVSSNQI